MTTLIPILGDQLSLDLSALDGVDPAGAVLLLMEVADETTYVRHHRRKLVYILSAMRHHADVLRAAGWQVDYVKFDDPDNAGSFTGEVARAIERHHPERILVTEPGEWRVQAMLEAWETLFGLPVEIRSDTRFIASHAVFEEWAADRATLTMEYFYREQRRRTGLLMEGDKPAGGKWNYDKQNRKPAPDGQLFMPRPPKFAADDTTRAVIAMVERRFPDLLGNLDDWDLAVTRDDALKAQAAFLDEALASFGDYQDAMLTGEPVLWHSHLSHYINSGLLDPLDLCRRAEIEYREGRAPLNAVEGFVRQIIGWREYVRGFYWRFMPGLADANELGASRPLPEFWWTGETDMRCLADCIRSTRDNAHAHHIQRLMVLGNFALLAGIDPRQVQDWFLVVYADAYDWVELPNVSAMALYADGGRLASKPYAASGNYINRMSNYCGKCAYSPAKKTGEGACPFNALYWDFMARHRQRFEANPRIGRIFGTWDKLGPDKQREYRANAAAFLGGLEPARNGWAR